MFASANYLHGIFIVFVLQDFSAVSESQYGRGLHGISVEDIRNATTRLDLGLHLFIGNNSTLHGYFMYQSDLFSPKTIQTFSELYQQVITAVIATPASCLSTISLVTDHDMQKLTSWNRTTVVSRREDVSIGELFRHVALQNSSSVAVVDGTTTLTYAMLDTQSDRLASWLVAKNLPNESIIGIVSDMLSMLNYEQYNSSLSQAMGRSVLLVLAYLGCLKAGMAYLPIDRSLPAERIHLMLQDTRSPLVLTDGTFLVSGHVLTVDLKRETEILLNTPVVALPKVSPNNLSNVIYTSGSTGTPKGVMLEHRGMANLCAPETTNWSSKMKNALTSSIAFDPSGFQILTSILTGSELYCLPDRGVFDAEEFQQFILESGTCCCTDMPLLNNILM